MSKQAFQSEISPATFYRSQNIECPKCHATFQLSADQQTIWASTVLFDQCPYCEATIIIDMADPSVVTIKAIEHLDPLDWVNELTRIYDKKQKN